MPTVVVSECDVPMLIDCVVLLFLVSGMAASRAMVPLPVSSIEVSYFERKAPYQ